MAAQSRGLPFTACPSCTQHLHQIHGGGFPPRSRSPSFFCLLPPFPSSAPFSLPIPPAFLEGRNVRVDGTSGRGEPLYSEMHLEGPSGATWSVAMEGPSYDDLAFTTGWEKFVEDHSLVAGDLLFFKLLSKGSFSVSIYGCDGCEKAEAFLALNSRLDAAMLKKRAAADKGVKGDLRPDADSKKRKIDDNKKFIPHVIDIDDDNEDGGCKGPAPRLHSEDCCEIIYCNDDVSELHPCVEERSDTCIFLEKDLVDGMTVAKEENHYQSRSQGCMTLCKKELVDEVTDANEVNQSQSRPQGCMTLCTKEDNCSQPKLLDVPLTPSNADKGNLAKNTQSEIIMSSKGDDRHDQGCLAYSSGASESEQDTSLSGSDWEEEDFKNNQCCTNNATQVNTSNDCLTKDYITEAFVSRRRVISEEERQRVLKAAKRFKSRLPHIHKLMKESHVYRGFWLSLPTKFAIKYLPQETRQGTLLDSSGKAWPAKWLGLRCGFSGGWRKFSLDHGLEEGDVCLFEIIDRKKPIMKVHIFRVVKLKNELPGREHYSHKPTGIRPFFNNDDDDRGQGHSTPVKKMRGAITCTSIPSHSPAFSYEVEDKDRKPKTLDEVQFITSRRAGTINNLQLSKTVKTEPNCGKAEVGPRRAKEEVGKAACWKNSTAEEAAPSLQTPPKKKEAVPGSLRLTRRPVLRSPRYYEVERLCSRRRGPPEEMFLVDLRGVQEPVIGLSHKVLKDGNAWWVPLSHFTTDKASCHL